MSSCFKVSEIICQWNVVLHLIENNNKKQLIALKMRFKISCNMEKLEIHFTGLENRAQFSFHWQTFSLGKSD